MLLSLQMAVFVVVGIDLAHLGDDGREGLGVEGRLVISIVLGFRGLEAPLETDVEPGVGVLVGPAGPPATPALVMGDDGEFDLAAGVAEGGGYAGLVGVDGELFGDIAGDGLEGGLTVAVMFVECGWWFDETDGKGAELCFEDGRVG